MDSGGANVFQDNKQPHLKKEKRPSPIHLICVSQDEHTVEVMRDRAFYYIKINFYNF